MGRQHHRFALLGLFSLSWIWCRGDFIAYAAQANVTVDDMDPSIVYKPAASWNASSVSCTSCLKPDTNSAFQNTFHDGTHILPLDEDDTPSSVASHSSTAPPTPSPTPSGDNDGGKKGGSDHDRRRIPAIALRVDSDDPGFVDIPVTAQFKFNGTAVYLYCIQPLGRPTSSSIPTSMNLSFTLDNQLYSPYLHNATDPAPGFTPDVNVFAIENLDQAPHVLLVNVGLNSVFLFDYMIYTHFVDSSVTTQTTTSSTSAASPVPSPLEATANSPHNVATFAGAVGGSVGVLGILALCIFFSIYRRRRLSARRDRLARDREGHSENSPAMAGPAPFVPRYFPGTVIPSSPPPYTPSSLSAGSSSTHTFPAAPAGVIADDPDPVPTYIHDTSPSHGPAPENTEPTPSYAEIPPSALPRTGDSVLGAPPPSFHEAISSPFPINPPRFSAPPASTLPALPPGISNLVAPTRRR